MVVRAGMLQCREARSLLEVFVDGELSPEQTLAVETHLEGCNDCGEHCRLLGAVKIATRDAVLEGASVGEAFEERLHAALLAERGRTEIVRRSAALVSANPLEGGSAGWRQRQWGQRLRAAAVRAVFPLAAAAALFFLLRNQEEPTQETAARSESEVAVVSASTLDLASIDQALDRLIDYHSAPPPAQVTRQDLLQTFERDVGVRVRAPRLDKFGASWEGAALVPVRNSQAASLRYRMPGKRFTVYVYDPRKVPVHRSLERRMVHDHPVYVGEWRGYTVAAKENRGIGYAMASDLDDALTAELLTEIH